jgi:WD repeat-containing protein 26
MRLSGSDQDSAFSVSLDSAPEAGPSSVGLDGSLLSNGHANGNGYSLPVTNGSSGNGIVTGNGVQKHTKGIGRVSLPGTTLYDDSHIDREEFVRLVIQSLRDVGYRYVQLHASFTPCSRLITRVKGVRRHFRSGIRIFNGIV